MQLPRLFNHGILRSIKKDGDKLILEGTIGKEEFTGGGGGETYTAGSGISIDDGVISAVPKKRMPTLFLDISLAQGIHQRGKVLNLTNVTAHADTYQDVFSTMVNDNNAVDVIIYARYTNSYRYFLHGTGIMYSNGTMTIGFTGVYQITQGADITTDNANVITGTITMQTPTEALDWAEITLSTMKTASCGYIAAES